VEYPGFHFWATVCKTVRPMLSDRCLSCVSCSVCDVGVFGQTVGRIKMKYGMKVGLGPGHVVLNEHPAPPLPKGAEPPPFFRPYLLWPNGWMDQDATWYGGEPQPRGLCTRWGPRAPSPQSRPNFRPMFIVAKRLDGSRCNSVRR